MNSASVKRWTNARRITLRPRRGGSCPSWNVAPRSKWHATRSASRASTAVQYSGSIEPCEHMIDSVLIDQMDAGGPGQVQGLGVKNCQKREPKILRFLTLFRTPGL